MLEHCREGETECWFTIFGGGGAFPSARMPKGTEDVNELYLFTLVIPVNYTSKFRVLFGTTMYTELPRDLGSFDKKVIVSVPLCKLGIHWEWLKSWVNRIFQLSAFPSPHYRDEFLRTMAVPFVGAEWTSNCVMLAHGIYDTISWSSSPPSGTFRR